MKIPMIAVAALTLWTSQAVFAEEKTVIQKVGAGIEKGAETVGSGIEKGVDAAGRGVNKGLEATGNGLKKAGEWVEEKTQKSDKKE